MVSSGGFTPNGENPSSLFGSLISPCFDSNLLTLSLNAFKNVFACGGAIIIREWTLALGTPGRIRVKSNTNSAGEWVTTTKFEYSPLLTSASSSKLICCIFFFLLLAQLYIPIPYKRKALRRPQPTSMLWLLTHVFSTLQKKNSPERVGISIYSLTSFS